MNQRLRSEHCPHWNLWKERMAGGSTGDYVCRTCGESDYGEEWAKEHRKELAARDPEALGYHALVDDVNIKVLPSAENEWEYDIFDKRTHTQAYGKGSSVDACKMAAIQIGMQKYPDRGWNEITWRLIDP